MLLQKSIISALHKFRGRWFSTATKACIQHDLTTDIPEISQFNNVKTYQELHKFSISNPAEFWGTLAASRIDWIKPFHTVLDCDMHKGIFKWFLGGELNVTVNCVDRHAKNTPDKPALIWEKDEPGQTAVVSYKELLDLVCQIANVLKNSGVKRGDKVAIYMPVSPIAVASMLACARIGAVHSVIYAGFTPKSLAERIQDAGAKTVLTADQCFRGGQAIQLKENVDAAVDMCPSVKQVFVCNHTGVNAPATNKDVDFDAAIASASKWCEPEPMASEDLLFMLYTSGSTGKPKGLVHTQAGYLLYTSVTQKFVFNYQEGDVFACVADIGWITGHSYVVYGPLSNGATTVLFESKPRYPDPGRYWDMVQRLRVNQFYCAPTGIRSLLRSDNSYVTKYDLSSLKVLASVGEPIDHDAWEWYHSVVGGGRCDVVDTWWQTETGGIAIAPRPSGKQDKIVPAIAMRPFFGIQPAILDSNGQEIDGKGANGACCIKSFWPGIARTIHGDHDRYVETYFEKYPGYYFSGDGVRLTSEGYYQLTGRMDDVMNISGIRQGSAEIEDVIDEHVDVSESAVVGIPHEIKGEEPFAFVIIKQGVCTNTDQLEAELQAKIKEKIAAFAVPKQILFADEDILPKTRSGKIMRRILRKIAVNDFKELGDLSTLAEPVVVDKLIQTRISMEK